jgi:hypothetical protein
MAFAIADGNFNDPAIWSTGVVPTGTEDAYANGKTVQITGTVTINSVRNDLSDVFLIDTATPLMTSNSNPTGLITATSARTGGEAFRAFDRNTGTAWGTPDFVPNGTITYKFPSNKIIKRYMFRVLGTAQAPRSWTFQASTNGTVWTDGVGGNPAPLDTQSNIGLSTGSTFSSALINPGNVPYEYYRIVVTLGAVNWPLQIVEIEMTESTSTASGQIPGGTFNLTNGSTLTCTAPTGVVVGSTTPTITFTLPFGETASVNATIPSVAVAAGYKAVLLNGLGTLNFTGNISYGPTSATGSSVIQITAAGKLVYTGVCTNGGSSTVICNSIFSSANATIEINTTGFSGGNFANIGTASVYLSAGGNLTITGPITGGNSPAVVIVGAIGGGTVIITGDVSTITGSPAISNITTAANIEPGGAITTSGSANAISSVGYVKVIVPLVNVNNWQAVYAPKITIEPATTSITFQKVSGGNQAMQIGSVVNATQPAVSDVRLGTTYGVVPNEFTGTMAVPLPSSVSLGVPVDTSVGTFLMTPASFVQELNTSSIDVAVRLRNSATVITTGTQLASFNI